jgi:hypothetical protein
MEYYIYIYLLWTLVHHADDKKDVMVYVSLYLSIRTKVSYNIVQKFNNAWEILFLILILIYGI